MKRCCPKLQSLGIICYAEIAYNTLTFTGELHVAPKGSLTDLWSLGWKAVHSLD